MPYAKIVNRLDGRDVGLHYVLRGNGPVRVLFVSGFTMGNAFWIHQRRLFDKYPDVFTTCTFDNRGVGRSDRSIGWYTTEIMGVDTLALLAHIGWTSRVHVVGFSMGGMVAQFIAARAPPGLIDSLSLVCTHRGGDHDGPSPSVLLSMGLLVFCDPLTRMERELAFQHSKAYLHDHRQELMELYLGRYMHDGIPPLAGTLSQLHAIMTHRVSSRDIEKIRRSPYPVLVVSASHDELVPTLNHHKLAIAYNAKMLVFGGAGHHVNVEQTERLNKGLFEFILEAVRKKPASRL